MKPKSTARKKTSSGKATSSKKSSDSDEKRFQSAFEGMLEGAQILGFDWRYLYLNPAAETHNHRPNGELLGNRYMDMWPGIEETHVFSEIKRCLEDRIPSRLENRFVYPDGRVGWFILGIQPISEGVLILSFDVTERVRAEQQATQMKRLYATLSQVNQTIVRVRDRQELFESICKVAVDFGQFRLAWIGLYNEESGKLSPVAEYGSAGNKLPFKQINAKEMPYKEGLLGLALRSGQVEFSNDIQADPRMGHWYETAIQGNYHSATTIPIRQGGKVFGLLNLYAADIDFFNVEEEQSLLKEMGLDISFALDIMETEAEHKQAEEALRMSEQKFKTLFEIAPVGISLLDKDRRLLNANKMLEKIARITADGLQAGAYRNRKYLREDGTPLPPDELASARVLKEGKPVYNLVNGIVTENDETIWTQVSAAPLDLPDAKVVVVTENITERKQTEEKLQAQTERLNLAAWSAGIGIWDWDIQKNKLIWDDRMYALYGIKPGDFGGAYEAWLNGLHPDDRAGSDEITNRALRGEGEYDTEFRVLWPDGSVHWLKAAGQVFRDQERQPLRMVGVNYDITERKQAEEVLHVRDAQLREAQIIAGLGNYRLDFATGIWRSSDILDMIFGIDETYEHSVAGWTALIHPVDRQMMTDYFTNDIIGKHNPFNKEYRIIRNNDGVERWVHGLGRLEFDAEGQLSFMVGTIQDITERKQAEEEIEQSHDMLIKLTAQVPGVVYQYRLFADGRSCFPFSSRGMNDIYEVMPEEVREDASPVFERLHPEDYDRVAEAIQESARTLQPFHCEYRVILPRQGVRWRLSDAQPERMEDGGTLWYGIISDITDRKEVEELIRQYASDLEKRVEERTAELLYASRAKDEFLANMSHELRTPLNGILGLSESLLEGISGPLNPKQDQSLQTIYSSGEHLLGLINDILDVSKIESGKFKIVSDHVSVNDLCISSLSFINQAALKKSIYVEYTRQPENTTMFGDPKHLKQILVNLLSNAVKFTPEKGSVKLGVDINEEEGRIRFSVQDTGVGISSEDLKKLFQPFVQLDNGLSRRFEGSGLGLVLVKKLTELHGGTVLVESEPGQGSNFIVTFPWHPDTERNTLQGLMKDIVIENDKEGKVNDAIKIFIAEDNEANVMVVRDYLEHFGYQVFVARNGREVLANVQEISPHLILMDIQMPELDGFEATRTLRSMPGFATVPIVALTAFAMPGDRERCLEAGMNEYMSKPVNLRLLLKLVRDLVE